MDMYATLKAHEAWLRRLEEEVHELRAEVRGAPDEDLEEGYFPEEYADEEEDPTYGPDGSIDPDWRGS